MAQDGRGPVHDQSQAAADPVAQRLRGQAPVRVGAGEKNREHANRYPASGLGT